VRTLTPSFNPSLDTNLEMLSNG